MKRVTGDLLQTPTEAKHMGEALRVLFPCARIQVRPHEAFGSKNGGWWEILIADSYHARAELFARGWQARDRERWELTG